MSTRMLALIVLLPSVFVAGCSQNGDRNAGPGAVPPANEVELWMTKGDQTILLQKQQTSLSFSSSTNSYPTIEVDSTMSFQTVDGFGYTLTGSSAYLINRMGAAERSALLNELFGRGEGSIGISYLRISIGASDLSPAVFSYDDMPAGQTDPSLANFSLAQDTVDLVPVLKQILSINPSLPILGSPWSAPAWMKDNANSMGGSLLPANYAVYAQYFVKYIQAMAAKGIRVGAVTVQNEPQHGGNNPSMLMTPEQQAEFIKNHLGPAFAASGLSTRIIIWDHNCDNPGYPISILNDPAARTYVDGSAFHLYAGEVTAMTTVHTAFPDKNLYFTEQWTGAGERFDENLKWHMKNVIIGTMKNWSRVALEWNLANDPSYGPHTPGGCTECRGALTINGSSYNRNVSYFIVAHASKFVPPGSIRIGSTSPPGLANVAFTTAGGKKVLIVLNESSATTGFNIGYKNKIVLTWLPAGAVGTYTW